MSASFIAATILFGLLLFIGLLWFAAKLYWLYTADDHEIQ